MDLNKLKQDALAVEAKNRALKETQLTNQGVINATKPNSTATEARTAQAAATTGKEFYAVTGAGMEPDDVETASIMSFAQFAQSLAVKNGFDDKFNEGSNQSLHAYIHSFLSKVYHQLYYVPNLKDNKVILVKPETLFIQGPSCNIIFPNMKTNIAYSTPYKRRPTRLMFQTDPVAEAGGQGTPVSLLTWFTYVDETKSDKTRNGLPLYDQKIVSLNDFPATEHRFPLCAMTDYEKRNGVFCSSENKGADLYLFLVTGQSKNKTGIVMSNTPEQRSEMEQVFNRLARYELARQRYSVSNGAVECYFNPYIVPGFPMTSIETSEGGLNIHGYVTGVVHSITERSWTTSVNFTCARLDTEPAPKAFPILESEYAGKIADTYKDMLGDTVVPVSNKSVEKLVEDYKIAPEYLSTSLSKVWRETPSLEDYLEKVADGAKVVVGENGYLNLENAPTSNFFNKELQDRLKEYTKQITSSGLALHISEVN